MPDPLKVKDITSTVIFTVDEEDSVRDAALLMREKGIGAVVVTRGGTPYGMLTERDILRKVVAAELNPNATKAKDIMVHPLITIDAGASLGEASDMMVQKNIRRLVVTEGQKIVGFFTQGAILTAYWTCAYCHNRISSEIPESQKEPQAVECSCGARYHQRCAEQVVTCLECSTKLLDVEYPDPEDTLPG
jgi:CBS domain-containing protein